MRRFFVALALAATCMAALSGCGTTDKTAVSPPAPASGSAGVDSVGPAPPKVDRAASRVLSGEEKAFFLAVNKDDTTTVTAMLKQNKKLVGIRNAIGYTPLMVASTSGTGKCAALLIASGADINAGTAIGRTPLHMASGQNHVEIVKMLLAKGADINVRNKNLGTPLHAAAAGDSPAVTAYLLSKGANVNATTKRGITPVIVALAKGYKDVAKILMDKGAKVDQSRLTAAKAIEPGVKARPGEDFCCENL